MNSSRFYQNALHSTIHCAPVYQSALRHEQHEDYFKQSFPKGYSWERSLAFDDRGICIARNGIT